MDFTGLDLWYFVTDIFADFQDLANADLLSLGVRVLVLFFGVVLFISLLKTLWRVFWDMFGGVFRWLVRLITAPYRLPRDFIRNRWRNYKAKKARKRYEKQQAIAQKKREQEEAERAKREAEIFERIMR
jgi:sensor histidine kinase YesM